MTTFAVTTHGNESYTVDADRLSVDETNTNRMTFYDADGNVVAQENNAASAHPVTTEA